MKNNFSFLETESSLSFSSMRWILLFICFALFGEEIIVDLRNPVYRGGVLYTDEGGVIRAKGLRIQARTIEYTQGKEALRPHGPPHAFHRIDSFNKYMHNTSKHMTNWSVNSLISENCIGLREEAYYFGIFGGIPLGIKTWEITKSFLQPVILAVAQRVFASFAGPTINRLLDGEHRWKIVVLSSASMLPIALVTTTAHLNLFGSGSINQLAFGALSGSVSSALLFFGIGFMMDLIELRQHQQMLDWNREQILPRIMSQQDPFLPRC